MARQCIYSLYSHIHIPDNLWCFQLNNTIVILKQMKKNKKKHLSCLCKESEQKTHSHSYRCLWRNNAWKLLWLERNETSPGCLQTEWVLMKIWEPKCHVWIDTETNRVRTLYKHTSQRDAHANKQWSTEENWLFPSPLHFPFFISPSTLHHSTCVRHVVVETAWSTACLLEEERLRSVSLFCYPPLKQNKASRRTRILEWEKWKLIIFLHVLPFIFLHMYLSFLISFLSQVMTRFSLSHFDNKYQDEGEV